VVKHIFKIISSITLLVWLSLSPSAYALTKLTASIDNNPVMSNESIVLTVTADDSVDREDLDTSVLLTDFVVARTEVSSNTSIVNFSTSRTTRWQIVLIPRKTGNLVIPALQVDGNYSDAISVQVLPPNSKQGTLQQDIFITAELSKDEVYVQQLVTLTVKLHISVQLQQASLTEPTLTGATIIQIGKDQESEGIINGKRYRLIERTYAITPEQSGKLSVVSPMFSGEIMVQSRRRSGFLNFGDTKPVNILGEKLELNVLPIPDSYDNNASWLPSEILTLHQEWQPSSDEFTVGEPITRTITLTAAGLSKEQLPKIVMTAPKGIKVYPDQAQLHANLNKERLVSQKKQNFAIVASKPGQYVLPKITIAWWNTVTNKLQHATLPEQIIKVLPNPDAVNTVPALTAADMLTETTELKDDATISTAQTIVIEKATWLQWLFLGLWLITLIAWFTHIYYLKRSTTATGSAKVKRGVNNHYLALMAACKQGNAEQVLALVVPWVDSLQSQRDIGTLADALTVVANDNFTTAINNIQQQLYGKNATASHWQGSELLKIIQTINADKINTESMSALHLNPA